MKVIYYGDRKQNGGGSRFDMRVFHNTIWFLESSKIKCIDLDEFKLKPLSNSNVTSYSKKEYIYDSFLSNTKSNDNIYPYNTGNNIVFCTAVPIPDSKYLRLKMERLFIIQLNIQFFVSKILLLEIFLHKDISKQILLLLTKAVVYYYDMTKGNRNCQIIDYCDIDEYYNIPKSYFIKTFFD